MNSGVEKTAGWFAGAHWAAFKHNAPLYGYFALRYLLLRAMSGRGLTLRGTLISLEAGAGIKLEGTGRLALGAAHLRRGAEILVQDQGKLDIGDGFFLGRNSTICCLGETSIGANVLIAERCSIYDHDHVFARNDIPFSYQGLKASPVRIGDNVWVGCGSFIGKGVTIGDNVVIGAGSVVTRDIPANTLVHGGGGLVMKPLWGGRPS